MFVMMADMVLLKQMNKKSAERHFLFNQKSVLMNADNVVPDRYQELSFFW